MDLGEFDRLADAAAKRAEKDRRHLDASRAALGGVGVATRELRCEHCSYFLPLPQTITGLVRTYAITGPHEAPQWNMMPKPSRPWRTVRCKHCKRTTVYVIP